MRDDNDDDEGGVLNEEAIGTRQDRTDQSIKQAKQQHTTNSHCAERIGGPKMVVENQEKRCFG
jgi:hypothetical protein